MPFQRFHGVSLLALGALLLLVQAIVIFEGRSSSAAKTAASEKRAETEARPVVAQFRSFEYLPGAIGIALSAAGFFALVRVQQRTIDEEQRGAARAFHLTNRL